MKPVNVARVLLLAGAAFAAVASTSSTQNQQPTATGPASTAPQPTAMDPAMATGLWKSNFGAVKLEYDTRGQPGNVHGVWVYDRNGQEVIGYFNGPLSGNVLNFSWQEPAPDGSTLVGAGYLVFDGYGERFSGKWWTNARDRQGEWTGERARSAGPPVDVAPPPDDYQPPPPY